MPSDLVITIVITVFVSLIVTGSIIRYKKTHVAHQKYKKKKSGHPENLPLSQVHKKKGRIDTGVEYEDIKALVGGGISRGLANTVSREKSFKALASVSKRLKGDESEE